MNADRHSAPLQQQNVSENGENDFSEGAFFASESTQVKQLMSMQEAANNSPQVQQLMTLQRAVNNSPQVNQTKATLPPPANHTGMPDALKSGIEGLSGISMDDVKVNYNSDQPAQLQAHAFAQGNEIHLGPGQEQHLPHEAWHVVQQKQGRVQPTKQLKGKFKVNDDDGLEQEADAMGAKALQMKPSQPQVLRSPATGSANQTAQLVVDDEAEQREIRAQVIEWLPEQPKSEQNVLLKYLFANFDDAISALSFLKLHLSSEEKRAPKQNLPPGVEAPVTSRIHGDVFGEYPLSEAQKPYLLLHGLRSTGTVPDGNCAFAALVESAGLPLSAAELRQLAAAWAATSGGKARLLEIIRAGMDAGDENAAQAEFATQLAQIKGDGAFGYLGLNALQEMFTNVLRIDVVTQNAEVVAGPGEGTPVQFLQTFQGGQENGLSHFYGTTVGGMPNPEAIRTRIAALQRYVALAQRNPGFGNLDQVIEALASMGLGAIDALLDRRLVESEDNGNPKQNVAVGQALGIKGMNDKPRLAVSGRTTSAMGAATKIPPVKAAPGRYQGKANGLFKHNDKELDHERHNDSETQFFDYFLQQVMTAKNHKMLLNDKTFDANFPPKERAALSGSVVIFTDRTPCVSCYALSNIFRRDFPNVQLVFVYARKYGLVGEKRKAKKIEVEGHPMFVMYEKSYSGLSEEQQRKLDLAEATDTNKLHIARKKKEAKAQAEKHEAAMAKKAARTKKEKDAREALAEQEEAAERKAEAAEERVASIKARKQTYKEDSGAKSTAKRKIYDQLGYMKRDKAFLAWWSKHCNEATVLAELYQFVVESDNNGLRQRAKELSEN